ncbi:WD-40 repeat-containing protein, partial [Reticulomyxa filosa]
DAKIIELINGIQQVQSASKIKLSKSHVLLKSFFHIDKNIFENPFHCPQKEKKKNVQVIIQHWIRILKIKLGWIKDFDKLVINYASTFFMFDTFRSSSKLINAFTGHINSVNSIDYSIFDDCQLICSGSDDNTICVWDVDNNKLIQSFDGYSNYVLCVKFSLYHYHNHHQNVICSSSIDKTIRFWDFKHNQQLQIFNGHTKG